MTIRRTLLSRKDALAILSHWICDDDICTRTLIVLEELPSYPPARPETTQEQPAVAPP